jgi:hypothetical protein
LSDSGQTVFDEFFALTGRHGKNQISRGLLRANSALSTQLAQQSEPAQFMTQGAISERPAETETR